MIVWHDKVEDQYSYWQTMHKYDLTVQGELNQRQIESEGNCQKIGRYLQILARGQSGRIFVIPSHLWAQMPMPLHTSPHQGCSRRDISSTLTAKERTLYWPQMWQTFTLISNVSRIIIIIPPILSPALQSTLPLLTFVSEISPLTFTTKPPFVHVFTPTPFAGFHFSPSFCLHLQAPFCSSLHPKQCPSPHNVTSDNKVW